MGKAKLALWLFKNRKYLTVGSVVVAALLVYWFFVR